VPVDLAFIGRVRGAWSRPAIPFLSLAKTKVCLYRDAIQPWAAWRCQLTESFKRALETKGIYGNQRVNAEVWEKLKRTGMRRIRSIETNVFARRRRNVDGWSRRGSATRDCYEGAPLEAGFSSHKDEKPADSCTMTA
jgi:hypothetical protein